MWVKILITAALALLSLVPFSINKENPADDALIASTWTFVGVCVVVIAIIWGSTLISVARLNTKRRQ